MASSGNTDGGQGPVEGPSNINVERIDYGNGIFEYVDYNEDSPAQGLALQVDNPVEPEGAPAEEPRSRVALRVADDSPEALALDANFIRELRNLPAIVAAAVQRLNDGMAAMRRPGVPARRADRPRATAPTAPINPHDTGRMSTVSPEAQHGTAALLPNSTERRSEMPQSPVRRVVRVDGQPISVEKRTCIGLL